jgi:Domain of unknown function (DUF4352)
MGRTASTTMPMPAMPLRSRVAASLVLTASLALAACGGGGDASTTKQQTPTPQAFAHRFTTQQVSDTFQALTGNALEVESSAGASFDVMDRSRSGDLGDDSAFTERYGTFNVYVLKDRVGEAVYKRGTDGKPIRPDADGLYWRGTAGSWTASKPYDNVVLAWITDDRRVDERFRRLDAVMRQVGKPVQEAQAALPPEQRSCASRGISATGGPEGSCREGTRTVQYVDRGSALKLPPATLRVLGTDTTRAYVSPSGYSRQVAKGRYVQVTTRVENTGDEAISSLYGVKLTVDGKDFTLDGVTTNLASGLQTFPIQPEDSSRVKLVFDVPLRVVDRALRRGELTVGTEEGRFTDPDYAAQVGHVRFGGHAKSSGGDVPGASPA